VAERRLSVSKPHLWKAAVMGLLGQSIQAFLVRQPPVLPKVLSVTGCDGALAVGQAAAGVNGCMWGLAAAFRVDNDGSSFVSAAHISVLAEALFVCGSLSLLACRASSLDGSGS